MFEAAIKHGTLVAVSALIVGVLGVAAAFQVPVQMIPDLEVRTISVETTWPGATPQDVEKEILIEQEEYLRTIPRVSRMKSTATTGQAVIELEFPFGTDENEALLEVNNALSQVPGYPENVDEPRIFASSFSENAFLYYRIGPKPDHPVRLNIDLLRDFVDDHVRTRMERVPGVSQVQINSGAERQVQILVDPARLAASGLALADVRDRIRSRNRDVSGGDVDSGKRRYLVRTVGRFGTVEELEELILARNGDAMVRLGDVAEVRLDHSELRQLAFLNDEPAIGLSVRRVTGSNVIAIKEAMVPVVERLQAEVLDPLGLEITVTGDDVQYVQDSVRNVWQNLALGAVLATLVMFLFLRSVPATLAGVIGIPICTIAAFFGLLVTGRTINVISLAGVAFAIGMTLDNSIVVLENITRMRQRGLGRREAAVQGVREVWPAVLASSMTTILVFTPVVLIEQEAGQLFSDIAIAIAASILTSMLVAVTVIPSLAARVKLGRARIASATERPPRLLDAIGWLVATRPRRLATLGATLVATVAAVLLLTPPAEYLPEGEEPKTFAAMIAPPGYGLPEMRRIAEDLLADLVPHVRADRAAFERGDTDLPPVRYLNTIVASEQIRVISEPVRPADIGPLMAALDRRFERYPGMRTFTTRGSIITSNDGGTRSVNLDITGNDLPALYETADRAYRLAEAAFENPQIGSEPSTLTLAQPLIEIRPDWVRASELGYAGDELGYAIAALSDGVFADEFLLGDDNIDIFLYGRRGTAQSLDRLVDLPLHTPSGAVVPLSAVAELEETVDTGTVRRLDGRRTLTLNIIPPRSVALETALDVVERDVVGPLRQGGLAPGIGLDISGASDQLDATREALTGNFLIALVLTYLLLVAVFTHWGYPLVIMTTVPLGIAGGIVGLALLNVGGRLLPIVGLSPVHQPFDMITMMGFLILLGTVVNNPILVVDRTLRNLREGGLGLRESVREAVAARLRPMLMTMITTVFGLAPLVFIPGAGTELYRGVGAIVLFGLLFATLVTLVFLPAFLVTVLEVVRRVRRKPFAHGDEGDGDTRLAEVG